MSQHRTHGPWIARPYPESKNQRITITGATSPVAIAEIVPTTMKGYDAVAEANGRLIAASPELLDSLKDMLSRFRSCIAQGNGEIEGDREAIAKAEAIIAKVKGGAI